MCQVCDTQVLHLSQLFSILYQTVNLHEEFVFYLWNFFFFFNESEREDQGKWYYFLVIYTSYVLFTVSQSVFSNHLQYNKLDAFENYIFVIHIQGNIIEPLKRMK